MSTGLYTHTTRATGTILTAVIYNGDHTNHITNQNPSMTGAYSDNVAQMQSTVTPGGVGSESLATSLAGELERLRSVIKTLHGGAQWYPGQLMATISQTVATIAGNTTLTVADVGQVKIVTAVADVTLPDVATLSNGQPIRFKSNTEQKVRLLPQGADTIDGDTEYLLPSYTTCEVMRSGAGTYVLSVKPDYVVGMMYPAMFAGKTPPRGFVYPDGTALSRTTYGGLFASSSLDSGSGGVTVTITNPGVFTWTNNKLQNNDPIEFTTTGALPTGFVINTTYYVVSNATDGVGKFRLAATIGGAAINATGSQSGLHRAFHMPYGRGDGSTTFNVADIRGRPAVGRDALGGTAASRITVGTSGINADTTGQGGGSQTLTIGSGNIPNFGLSHNAGGVTGSGSYFPNSGATLATPNGAASVTTGTAGTALAKLDPLLVTHYMVKT